MGLFWHTHAAGICFIAFEQQTLGSSLYKVGSVLKYSGEWPCGDTYVQVCLLLYGTVKWNSGQCREWVKSVSYFLFSFTQLLLENYWVLSALWFFKFSHPLVEFEILNADIINDICLLLISGFHSIIQWHLMELPCCWAGTRIVM